MLKSYRITKYNPQKRNEEGFYIDINEWTSIYDLDKQNIDEYIEVENKYIKVVQKFMKINKIKLLNIKNYEKKDEYEDIKYKKLINKNIYNKIKNDMSFSFNEIPTLIRLILRENMWCKMFGDRGFFVHFGYDLYMYIGFNPSKKIERKINNILIKDIYIEEYRSPYLK